MSARAAYAAIAPGVVPSQPAPQTLKTTIYPLAVARGGVQNVDSTEIELKEANDADLDGEGEEEIDYDISDYDDEEDEEEEEDGSNVVYDVETHSYRYSVSPEAGTEPEAPPSRKRSCDELDDGLDVPDDASSEAPSSRISGSDRREQGGTPPKRARLGDVDLLRIPAEEFPAPARQKKRSSEELEDHDVSLGPVMPASNKRTRVRAPPSPSSASPRSIYSSVDAEDAMYSSIGDEVEDTPYVPPRQHRDGRVRGMRKADMDKLIPLDDMDE